MNAQAVVAEAVERGVPGTDFRSIFAAGAPRFVREAFGPVAAFYVGYELGSLVVGIVLATGVGVALNLYERKRGRAGALALVSVGFILVQAAIGIAADSATVYLAQPVLVSAISGIANIVSVVLGDRLQAYSRMRGIPSRPRSRHRGRTVASSEWSRSSGACICWRGAGFACPS